MFNWLEIIGSMSCSPSASTSNQDKKGLNVIDEHFAPKEFKTVEAYLTDGDQYSAHHLIRYEWAMSAAIEMGLAPVSILDIACGSGYGTLAMAHRFKNSSVVGADYDESAVEAAKELKAPENLSFVRGDLNRWEQTLGHRTFDLIVSFDTLEHVVHRELALLNIIKHLDRSGYLLFSTPVHPCFNLLKPEWDFHRIEYSAELLFDFLSRYFDEVSMPGQEHFPAFSVFEGYREKGLNYLNTANPVVCRKPRLIRNPFTAAASYGQEAHFFDGGAYLQQNADVAALGMNPLHHYLTHGVLEGRSFPETCHT